GFNAAFGLLRWGWYEALRRRLAVRLPDAPQEPRLYPRRGPYAGVGHGRFDYYLQCRECRSPPSIAISGARKAGAAPGRTTAAQRHARPDLLSGYGGLAAREPGFRRHCRLHGRLDTGAFGALRCGTTGGCARFGPLLRRHEDARAAGAHLP